MTTKLFFVTLALLLVTMMMMTSAQEEEQAVYAYQCIVTTSGTAQITDCGAVFNTCPFVPSENTNVQVACINQSNNETSAQPEVDCVDQAVPTSACTYAFSCAAAANATHSAEGCEKNVSRFTQQVTSGDDSNDGDDGKGGDDGDDDNLEPESTEEGDAPITPQQTEEEEEPSAAEPETKNGVKLHLTRSVKCIATTSYGLSIEAPAQTCLENGVTEVPLDVYEVVAVNSAPVARQYCQTRAGDVIDCPAQFTTAEELLFCNGTAINIPQTCEQTFEFPLNTTFFPTEDLEANFTIFSLNSTQFCETTAPANVTFSCKQYSMTCANLFQGTPAPAPTPAPTPPTDGENAVQDDGEEQEEESAAGQGEDIPIQQCLAQKPTCPSCNQHDIPFITNWAATTVSFAVHCYEVVDDEATLIANPTPEQYELCLRSTNQTVDPSTIITENCEDLSTCSYYQCSGDVKPDEAEEESTPDNTTPEEEESIPDNTTPEEEEEKEEEDVTPFKLQQEEETPNNNDNNDTTPSNTTQVWSIEQCYKANDDAVCTLNSWGPEGCTGTRSLQVKCFIAGVEQASSAACEASSMPRPNTTCTPENCPSFMWTTSDVSQDEDSSDFGEELTTDDHKIVSTGTIVTLNWTHSDVIATTLNGTEFNWSAYLCVVNNATCEKLDAYNVTVQNATTAQFTIQGFDTLPIGTVFSIRAVYDDVEYKFTEEVSESDSSNDEEEEDKDEEEEKDGEEEEEKDGEEEEEKDGEEEEEKDGEEEEKDGEEEEEEKDGEEDTADDANTTLSTEEKDDEKEQDAPKKIVEKTGIVVDRCTANQSPCKNNGTCDLVDAVNNTYQCTCSAQSAWSGAQCKDCKNTQYNETTQREEPVCKNNGVVKTFGQGEDDDKCYCTCDRQYAGALCSCAALYVQVKFNTPIARNTTTYPTEAAWVDALLNELATDAAINRAVLSSKEFKLNVTSPAANNTNYNYVVIGFEACKAQQISAFFSALQQQPTEYTAEEIKQQWAAYVKKENKQLTVASPDSLAFSQSAYDPTCDVKVDPTCAPSPFPSDAETSPSNDETNKKNDSNTALIVVLVIIAVLIVVAILIVLICCCLSRSNKKRAFSNESENEMLDIV